MIQQITCTSAGEDALILHLPEPATQNYPMILGQLAQEAIESGALEAVPAYHSVLVSFNPDTHSADSFSQCLSLQAKELIDTPPVATTQRVISIPVCYDGEHAIDLADIAAEKGLTTEDVIQKHLAQTYTVCCLGFIPGFAFLGFVDDAIATPRHQSPRSHVPAGSVGIAGTQTGVYPSDSPGGWQIIGRTPLELYAPEKRLLSRFEMGDTVKFYRISSDEFNNWEGATHE